MKYLKHMLNGGVASYQPEGTNKFIPPTADNLDYVRMMQEVDSGTSEIEEVE
jgi:hypothetical protein|tara:strand:+ start:9405 stop:9560 length:156 start_codon:yes stop_codon:yes gene_type:complete